MTTNTTDEIVAHLNRAISDLKRAPGKSDWAQGYDAGFIGLAEELIYMLTTTEEE